ncbi:TatD family hydrolase [Corynebacterium sp.]|uniref:TatD family hydrolase n=1 Tax=Corynebacterium sp. TaxID=1720 RepID=UPI0026DBE384|nr:TatD family hydrolase [Corynebacterium sp.]MDO5033150.1 TatD family hydrolase [Corynebacterium sp.]
MRLLDTHHHLDFLPPGERGEFLAQLALDDVHLIAQTTTPSGFLRLEEELAAAALSPDVSADVRTEAAPALAGVSVGFHPWYIGEDYEAELEVFADALQRTRLVGEVGLDFAPRRLEAVPAERQEAVLRGVLEAASAREGAAAGDAAHPVVLSIHTVRSAGQVLDLLADYGALGCGEKPAAGGGIVPVFHRFGGTSDELTHLIRGGGFISVNPLMLGTKKGRAYVTQVPASRLLLESDLPPDNPAEGRGGEHAAQLRRVLAETVTQLADVRGCGEEELAQLLQENSRALYGCG